MKVEIIAEKVDARVELQKFTTTENFKIRTEKISGSKFDVKYEANEDFLVVTIYFRPKGQIENLQKEIELKFKTKWILECSSPGVDCPVIDPRNNDTKVSCYPEKSIRKLIFFSDPIYEYF